MTQPVFEAAQRSRLERKTKPELDRKGSGGPKGKHFTNLFLKLAVCDYCGKPMHYDQFESTFLSFVEQLDLASLVRSSEQYSCAMRVFASS